MDTLVFVGLSGGFPLNRDYPRCVILRDRLATSILYRPQGWVCIRILTQSGASRLAPLRFALG